MADDFQTFPGRSPDPYLRYEPPSSSERVKGANKKLSVAPQLGEVKPQLDRSGEVSSPRRFQKLISGMWNLVQKVIDSTHRPSATKTLANPRGMTQQEYVEKCFTSFTDHFKELYETISNHPDHTL